MPTATTFRSQSLSNRLRKWTRKVVRLQYPLSELSEGFDIERYGASSLSASTRRSVSSWKSPRNQDGTPDANTTDEIDIIVVDKVEESDSARAATEPAENHTTIHGSEQGSTRYTEKQRPSTNFLTTRLWPIVYHFFDPAFQDPQKEAHYQKESWFLSKRIALITSIYYYVAWGLLLGLLSRPWGDLDYIAWIGISTPLIVPLLPFILFDLPKTRAHLWQPYLLCLTYIWPLIFYIQLLKCNFYSRDGPNTCGARDFIGLFYYLCALPTIALLAFNQKRLFHLLGTIGTLLCIAISLIPLKQSWIRHFFNYLIFQGFMLYVSYAREKADRKVFTLRDQLKTQYKATQKAQAAESRASDSKKRFVNYIFHEVRVPLNTALLSIQNLIGENALQGASEDHLELVDVLQSSLGMMEKVLNDVLDFNRMDSGRLMVVNAPFDFTKVIKSVVMSLSVAAGTKNISLSSQLDPRIESFGDLIGDEMRLRQVLSNLTSNACKFTGTGGFVTLKTALLSSPSLDNKKSSSEITAVDSADSKTSSQSNTNKLTIRLEVIDSGIGIKAKDVRGDRLFSPYVQTEIGKRQGGKGTGLGLALVRNIVQLSGGRLGLQSTVGQGSTFWIEQDFIVADPAQMTAALSNTSIEKQMPAQVAAAEIRNPRSDSGSTHSAHAPSLLNVPEDIDVSPRPGLTHLHSSEFEMVTVPSAVAVPRPFSPGDLSINTTIHALPQLLDPVSTRRCRILVVDDDQLTRRLMTRMITRLGHEVESAENGSIALKMLKADLAQSYKDPNFHPFDLVFLDNQMPVLSGVEMSNLARLEGIETMICGVTGNAMKEDQDDYLEAGADFVLTKPVMEASIRTVIQHAIKRVTEAEGRPREPPRATVVNFPEVLDG